MSIELYPDFVKENRPSPEEFSADVDQICEEIESATKKGSRFGSSAKRDAVLDALATKDDTTRTKISLRFMELYGDPNNNDPEKMQTMADWIHQKFSGDLGTLMEFLALPPHQAECAMIRKATKGVVGGVAVNVVWSIICGRTNEEMELLRKTYFEMYDQDLGKLLGSKLHGNLKQLIFNCLQANQEEFDPDHHTWDKARDDAEILYSKGQGRPCGIDEKGIFKILAKMPAQHLVQVDKVYAEKYGFTVWKAIQKKLNGVGEKQLRNAVLFEIGMKLNPYETMSNVIDQACHGGGLVGGSTDSLLLTCSLIRYQSHLSNIMACHIEEYGKTIQERVRQAARGKYRDALLQIVNTVRPEDEDEEVVEEQ